MALTVADLVAAPHLGITVLAGSAGLDRTIRWAHASELADPTAWLEGGELLMTVGMAIPRQAARQREYVMRLVERGVVAIALSTRGAPPLSRSMVEAADEQRMPLLDVATEVPFSEIARLVAFASEREVHDRLLTHVRILDAMRARTAEDLAVGDLVARLERLSGYRIYLSSRRGEPLLPEVPVPPAAVAAVTDFDGASPVIPTGFVVQVPLRGHPGAFVTAVERPGAAPAGLVAVQHIAAILAVELEKVRLERAGHARAAASAFRELLVDGREQDAAEARLATAGFRPDDEVAVVAAEASPETERETARLTEYMSDIGLPIASVRIEQTRFVLVRSDPRVKQLFDEYATGSVGVSRDTVLGLGLHQPRQEALLALGRARKRGGVVRYSADDGATRWLPTDEAMLREVVERILGPVIAYERENETPLMHSLRTYLEHDRRLTEAAQAMYVHKHTLAYRIRRVEELLGRSLRSVETLVDLWLALQAHRLLVPSTNGSESAPEDSASGSGPDRAPAVNPASNNDREDLAAGRVGARERLS